MKLFGTLPTGEEIYRYKLSTSEAEAEIISYGATIRSFRPFGREIIGGFATLEDYMARGKYYGASVGRVCNRIAGASFEMDSKIYELTRNNGESCLHGGSDGYHDKAWELIEKTESSVTLGYTSPDGQSGFPGEVRVRAEFRLEGSSLSVTYRAVPARKTPIMITSHGYFNLTGFETDVLDHTLLMHANEYTEIGSDKIPTGRHVQLVGSPLDFTVPRKIGEKIGESPMGYDHNFILSPSTFISHGGRSLGLAAEVYAGDMCLITYTDQPGIQLYVPTREMAIPLKDGKRQPAHGAFCLEAQIEPNCVKRGVGFVDAGCEYVSTTVYTAKRINTGADIQ